MIDNKTKTQNNLCRQTGIDILKIISMILITIIHYTGYSKILDSESLIVSNRIVLIVFRTCSLCAVNLFVMITGYLICDRETRYHRPFKIWSESWFYSVLLLVIGFMINNATISLSDYIRCFLPFLTNHYWYVSAVIILYLLSPQINKTISTISNKDFKYIIFAFGAFITIYYASNPFIQADIYIGHPHGIIWINYLYLLGAYFKRTEPTTNKRLWAILGIITFLLSFYFSLHGITKTMQNIELVSQYSLISVLMTISFFILIKDIKIPSDALKRIATVLAESSFGVYLIQEHSLIRTYYWNCFNANLYSQSPLLLLQMITSIVFLWVLALGGHCLFKHLYNRIGIRLYSFIVNTTNKTRSIIK